MTLNLAFAALVTGAVLAQGATPPDCGAAIKELLAKNSASLRTYSWVEDDHDHLEG